MSLELVAGIGAAMKSFGAAQTAASQEQELRAQRDAQFKLTRHQIYQAERDKEQARMEKHQAAEEKSRNEAIEHRAKVQQDLLTEEENRKATKNRNEFFQKYGSEASIDRGLKTTSEKLKSLGKSRKTVEKIDDLDDLTSTHNPYAEKALSGLREYKEGLLRDYLTTKNDFTIFKDFQPKTDEEKEQYDLMVGEDWDVEHDFSRLPPGFNGKVAESEAPVDKDKEYYIQRYLDEGGDFGFLNKDQQLKLNDLTESAIKGYREQRIKDLDELTEKYKAEKYEYDLAKNIYSSKVGEDNSGTGYAMTKVNEFTQFAMRHKISYETAQGIAKERFERDQVKAKIAIDNEGSRITEENNKRVSKDKRLETAGGVIEALIEAEGDSTTQAMGTTANANITYLGTKVNQYKEYMGKTENMLAGMKALTANIKTSTQDMDHLLKDDKTRELFYENITNQFKLKDKTGKTREALMIEAENFYKDYRMRALNNEYTEQVLDKDGKAIEGVQKLKGNDTPVIDMLKSAQMTYEQLAKDPKISSGKIGVGGSETQGGAYNKKEMSSIAGTMIDMLNLGAEGEKLKQVINSTSSQKSGRGGAE